MYVVRAALCLYDLYILAIAQVPQYLADLNPKLAAYHLPPVLRANTMWYLQFHFV